VARALEDRWAWRPADQLAGSSRTGRKQWLEIGMLLVQERPVARWTSRSPA
jgi:ABC-type uncharacterized transport system ATPase subunit